LAILYSPWTLGGKGKGKGKAKGKKAKGKKSSKGKGRSTKGKSKEKAIEGAGESGRRKRKRGEDSDEDADGSEDDEVMSPGRRKEFDASLLEQGILAGVAVVPNEGRGGHDVEMRNIDPVLLAQSQADGRIPDPMNGTYGNGSLPPSFSGMPPSLSTTLVDPSPGSFPHPKPTSSLPLSLGPSLNSSTQGPSSSLQDTLEASLSTALTEEVEGYLHDAQAETLSRALDQEEERRRVEREERWRRAEEVRKRREMVGGGSLAGMEVEIEGADGGAGLGVGGEELLAAQEATLSSSQGTQGEAPPPPPGQHEGAHSQSEQASGTNEEPRAGQGEDEEIDELTGLDEAELDKFLLSPAEVKIKERVWVELNRDYLEALAGESFFLDLCSGFGLAAVGFGFLSAFVAIVSLSVSAAAPVPRAGKPRDPSGNRLQDWILFSVGSVSWY
jgi:Brf1-like TBP-binding domain